MTFKVPHTLSLLFFLMFAALVATWIIPQGSFETEWINDREVVLPDTYQQIKDGEKPDIFSLFMAIPRAFADAQGIIFFLFIIGGVLAVIRKTGTIDALIGWLLIKFRDIPGFLIFITVASFALTSSAIGAAAEYIPFVLILAALCRSLKMDTMVAVAIIITGYGIGYGASAFNQYTVVVAQGIAELPTYSGWQIRMGMLVPFVLLGVHHIYNYSKKVQNDPAMSLIKDVEFPGINTVEQTYSKLKASHIFIMLMFVFAMIIAVWGISQKGWYLNELGAVFLILGFVSAIIGRIGPNVMAKEFVKGAQELVETALLVGVARGIALIMEDGQILHTIVHSLSIPLGMVSSELAGVGMMFIQTILNVFIPSGSGQAFVTMPLMAPLSDILGLSRQIAVQAFLFGDGFANMIIPTNAVLMGILGMARVPYETWFRFCLPLLFKLLTLAAIFMIALVWFGFS